MLQRDQSGCNAWSHSGSSCQLAVLSSLAEPGPGELEQRLMLDTGAGLATTCRGGEHCCQADNQCGEGAGDCNTHQDCAGLLVCGQDNCGQSGGRWDAGDDCCERACTADHPCREGAGHCTVDTDCVNPGWAACGNDLCLNTAYFPTALYPNNTAGHGYSGSDNCCYRKCNKVVSIENVQ